MKSRVIARRYAEAFFEVIRETNFEEAYEEFSGFMEAMHRSSELGFILKHPGIEIERKTALLKTLLGQSKYPVLYEFFCLLLRRNRFIFIELIAREVRALYRREKHIIHVQVRTAVPLLESERSSLIARLKSQVQGTIELQEKVEPSIKGGMIVRFAEKVLDTSVHTRLKLLRERLAQLKSELLADVESVSALIDIPVNPSPPPGPSH